jgi:hypothetical protein
MTNEQKALPPVPTVTAIVIESGRYRATIGGTLIKLEEVGPRGGVTTLFSATPGTAQQILDLVAAGRAASENLSGKQ